MCLQNLHSVYIDSSLCALTKHNPYMANIVKCQTADIGRPRSIQLEVHYINMRSVKNKTLSVADVVISRDIDILPLTETWLGGVIDDHVIS